MNCRSGVLQDGQDLRRDQTNDPAVGDKMRGRHGNKGFIAKIPADRDIAVPPDVHADPNYAQPRSAFRRGD